MVTITECPSCGEQKLVEKLSCKDYTVSHETFSISECTTCTTRITTPRPDDSDIYKYYLSDDYISHTSSAKTIIDKLYLFARKYTLTQKLKLISGLNNASKTILDYGCGTGEFLRVCKLNDWHINGIEPSTTAREKAMSLLSTSIFESIDQSHQIYNIVTLWHVLEHVPNPSETLAKISAQLSYNGTIIVAVPNYKSYDAYYYKQYWGAFDVPRHLWHFSREGMHALLEKNNLQLIKTKPMLLDSFYVALLSEKYKRGKLNIQAMMSAFSVGLLSNLIAVNTKNHSSLIYIIKKK